uniref:1-phosphatidylinositol 4-kinase n=1 Tax=Globodera pallida TaxID=36090 RepID=A0A183CE67_GLOPA
MHDRNIFKAKCFIGAGGKVCMNFSDAEAVRLLTRILLLEYFQLDVQLPEGPDLQERELEHLVYFHFWGPVSTTGILWRLKWT